ncbi:hypothetical protein TeGR_g4732 [Tetraparma gracilis]|uniref:Uncharacterized protein n=1 Tax=Tetraparma gracilis TaxID=2962635 RepID=A0ABQ6MYH9_9STRA|nr:hypothetical protein TeGR_g4732 [Tetraparma gracilis]
MFALATRLAAARLPAAGRSAAYSNITYSGGHASTGQGGYYGSGGSRSLGRDKSSPHRPEAVAHAQDVAVLEGISGEVEVLEASLLAHGDAVSNATIELSAKLKKMVTQGSVMEVLDKLEFKGEPVWGLSERERELVLYMRQKVNEV